MTSAKLTILLSAAVFFIYGVGFTVAPTHFSQLVTGSVPSSGSGLIDMRATYGGMSIATGILLYILSRSEVRLGLIGVVIFLSSMALTRAYGMVVDGEANTYMYVYLALEVVVAVVAAILLKKT
ncbi:DUF4345 family protein [Leucothrix mucor]|uniref:DUF4345 family protein n=1 Tax=Leucothrix mucor TaxID=45248 RepID=UPI0003B5575A|nr:DUF4345 family protein [Leucothrix mucor]